MTKINGSIKFDQTLWDARSLGYRSESPNPFFASSSSWAAFEAGRAFGLGRVSTARGYALNVALDHGNYRITFDELAGAPDCAPTAVLYQLGIDLSKETV